ncbi:hypothetical protein D769_04339 [Cupriavidus sp. HMR-1]|uniref:hypothetical protein n=1 Tax=Cupriavidus sp. HMR-1 TaxID=1249621 RepID=UPI0002A3102F|nr:hypothetical protein [Cupriavidus sp. HMR-1]ELA00628.1 hypothetical protein D769_04339 [Cupriavidus sp. HMR-1]
MTRCVFCRDPGPPQAVTERWLAVRGYSDTTAFCCPPCARFHPVQWLELVGYALEVPRAGQPLRTLAAALKSLRAG